MRKRLATVVLTSLALSLVGGGCTLLQTREPALDTAQALADGFTDGELSAVQVTGFDDGHQAQQWWDDLVAGMGESRAEVDVAAVDEEDDLATATLRWQWELGRAEMRWSYETTAELAHGDGGWSVRLEPSVVEPSLQDGEVLRLTELPPERGDILGAGGTRLVTERPVVRFGIDKTQVAGRRQAESARALARLLDVDAQAYLERVTAAGGRAFVEALVLRTGDVPPEVDRGYVAIPGAVALEDELPLAPTRTFAREVLGTVGPVTAELLEASDGAYQVGDEVGLSGLQRRYDEQLRGVPGAVVHAAGGADEESRELVRLEPEPGEPLRTTIDADLQTLAEQVLAGVRPASAVVAIRPSDGSILAAASGPGSEGYPTAMTGQYAPGSTFKVVTSLALLRSGMSPESVLPCTETVTVDGKPFENYDAYPAAALGEIPLRTAFANSCNTAFIQARDAASQADLAEAAAALGLGVDHDLGAPAYFGSVPPSGTGTEHAASMIGQGKVLASPMAMAVVAASVSEGRTVVPRLLRDDEPDTASPDVPLTAEEASRLREMMRAVVTDGSAAFLAGVPGAPVLAKTGTAEFGAGDELRTHAWMVAAQGDLAVSVFVEVGDSGSQTAGPLLRRFLDGAQPG